MSSSDPALTAHPHPHRCEDLTRTHFLKFIGNYLLDTGGTSNRDNDHIFVDTLRRIVNTEPMTYERLVA